MHVRTCPDAGVGRSFFAQPRLAFRCLEQLAPDKQYLEVSSSPSKDFGPHVITSRYDWRESAIPPPQSELSHAAMLFEFGAPVLNLLPCCGVGYAQAIFALKQVGMTWHDHFQDFSMEDPTEHIRRHL